MSPLISEPFPYHSTKEFFGPLSVINASGDALAIAEIKLCQIAVKVIFLAMLIDALHATFEDREKSFHGVSVDGRIGKGNIFALTMPVQPCSAKCSFRYLY